MTHDEALDTAARRLVELGVKDYQTALEMMIMATSREPKPLKPSVLAERALGWFLEKLISLVRIR